MSGSAGLRAHADPFGISCLRHGRPAGRRAMSQPRNGRIGQGVSYCGGEGLLGCRCIQDDGVQPGLQAGHLEGLEEFWPTGNGQVQLSIFAQSVFQ